MQVKNCKSRYVRHGIFIKINNDEHISRKKNACYFQKQAQYCSRRPWTWYDIVKAYCVWRNISCEDVKWECRFTMRTSGSGANFARYKKNFLEENTIWEFIATSRSFKNKETMGNTKRTCWKLSLQHGNLKQFWWEACKLRNKTLRMNVLKREVHVVTSALPLSASFNLIVLGP